MPHHNRPHALMFHHFHGGSHPVVQGSISSDRFIDILKLYGPSLISASEWLAKALDGKLATSDVCISFDDTLKCQIDVALPVLDQFNLDAFWFLYTSPLEGVPEKLELFRHFRATEYPSIDTFYSAFFDRVSLMFPDMEAPEVSSEEVISHLSEFPFYTNGDRKFRLLRDHYLKPDRYARVMNDMMEQRKFDIDGAARSLWMTISDVKQLHSEGHVLGLHPHTHPTRMSALSEVEQFQIVKCLLCTRSTNGWSIPRAENLGPWIGPWQWQWPRHLVLALCSLISGRIFPNMWGTRVIYTTLSRTLRRLSDIPFRRIKRNSDTNWRNVPILQIISIC